MNDKTILITAAGSIGERHIRNLWQLGYRNLIVFRTRNLPFRDIGEATVAVVLNWNEALACGAHAAFITSPTHLHLQQATDCIKAGMHVFIEKPIAHTLKEKAQFNTLVARAKTFVFVAYMLPFHPLLKQMKTYVQEARLGRLLHIESYWGEYLPDWHPWEDYKKSYAAQKSMGGGVALTLSHEIDTALWLAGQPLHNATIFKKTVSALPIDAENMADVYLDFGNETVAHIHMNYVEKKAQRYTELLFEDGRLRFEYFKNTLTLSDFRTGNISEEILPEFDRNDLFIAETHFFFQQIEKGAKGVTDNINRAWQVVEICTSNEKNSARNI